MLRRRAWLLFLLVFACCGPSARDKALRASYVALTGAAEGFAEWDATHQQQILDSSTDRTEFDRRINDYRLKRTAVVQVVTTAYKLLATALIEPEKVSVTQVVDAVAAVVAAISDLKGGAP